MFVIHGSPRPNRNTETLTHVMIDGIQVTQIYLRNYNIQPVTDQRHDTKEFQPFNDDYRSLVEQMLAHHTITFATPLYWYGMSRHMKNFIERWSQSFQDASLPFKEKMKSKQMYVVIFGGDHPT